MTDDTSYRTKGRAVFLAAIMVVSMVAAGAAFAGSAAAAVDTTDRTIDEVELEPGETTEVTVSVSATEESNDLRVIENFDPAFADVTVIDDSDATISEVTDANDELAASWGGVEDVTLTYEVEVSEDAEEGDEFTLSGTAEDRDNDEGNVIDIEGDTTITVAEADNGNGNGNGNGAVDADDYDRMLQEGDTVFQGQLVQVSADQIDAGGPFGDDEVELRRVDDGEVAGLVSTPSVIEEDGDQYYILDTENRDADRYVLTTESRNTDVSGLLTFEVAVQDLSVEFDEDEVGDVEGDSEVELDIESDIRNSYIVEVTADGLDEEELEDVFTQDPESTWNTERTDGLDRSELHADRGSAGDGQYFLDEDDESIILLNAEGDEHVLNFTDIDQDEYEFEFEVYDSTAEDSDSIEVVEGDEGQVNLVDATLDEEVGSVAEIELETVGGADEASIAIGDEDDIGYQLNATVDFDGEDSVTLLFNTYAAGSDEFDGPVLVEDGDNDAEVMEYEQNTDIEGILDSGDYEINVRAGADDVSDFEDVFDDADDLGSLFLDDRSTDAWNLWTAPGGADEVDDLEDGDDVVDAVEDGILTETDQVAHDDYLVHELDASGVAGILAATGESDAEDQFIQLFDGDQAFAHQDVIGGQASWELRVRETRDSAGPNVERSSQAVQVDSVIVDEDANSVYVVQEMDDVMDLDGDEFDETEDYEFEVRFRNNDVRLLDFDPYEDEDTELSDAREQLDTEYDLLEREFEFSEDPYNVTNADDIVFEGDTTVAPGSEFDARVRSTDDTSPRFNINEEFSVDEDRNWASDEFDLSETSVGDTFTLSLRNTGADERPEVDGNIVEPVDDEPEETEEPETEEPETEEPETEEPETEEPETEEPETEEPDTEEPDTDDDTPGFGAVVALVALLAAALLATRRRP